MRRKVVSIVVMLVAFASIVFAGSSGMPVLPSGNATSDEVQPTSSNDKKRDFVYLKSDEGWQMEHNGRKIMVVVGNFAAFHHETVITADSAVRYTERHIECFGNVLINRGSTYIYGDRAEYNGDTNEAKVYSKIVKVVDGDATLYTYNFTFNTETNIGNYSGGGVLVSKDNILESDRGYVMTDTHEIVCVDRVQMRNSDYDMTSDSVVYNTETDFAQFFERTNIWDKNKEGGEDDYLYADRGTFDKRQQLYKLTRRGYILTKDQELLCDSLDYYRDSNYVLLRRNIQIDDRSQKMLVFGDWGEYWKEPGNVFVTKNPSLISYDTSESDSVFMRSDSIYIYTHYPIREQIEKARKDSIEQASKLAARDSLKKSGVAEPKENKGVKPEVKKKDKEKEAAPSNVSRREEMMRKPEEQKKHAQERMAQKRDSLPTIDTTKVAESKPVEKTKAELRRELIDSLASDTTKQGKKLRAKLLKQESEEVNKAVKAAMKETQRKQQAERKVVLAEREALFARLLGEARVRDAERSRIEKEREKRVKDSLKVVQDSLKRIAKLMPDSVKVDSIKRDTIKIDSVKVDSLKRDSLLVTPKLDSIKVDSVKIDSIKVDSVRVDSVKVDTLAKFDTMTVKQVKAYFKAIYDKEKAEQKRIEQDSLNAKLDRIGLARQAKRTEQYRKWAIRDSIYLAKEQLRADKALVRRLARQEKRGIFVKMADSATLAKVDSTLVAELGPLDSLTQRMLDSLIEILYPKPLPSPTAMEKSDTLNIDSLYREVRAFGRVKMFRSDAQSICDSLTMTTIDSIINMYKSPVLWNGSNQIISEVMHIYTHDSQLTKAVFEGKPMMIAEIDTTHYNQVAGKEMTSLFRDNQIYRNDVNGNVQTIYYMQEDNSPEITLMAYIEAGDMTSYIEKQEVVGITYRGNPVYTFYPMDKIPETQPTKLQGFKWEALRRPTQDSVFTRIIRPSQREEKRALRKPLFPINALLQQRKNDYIRRKEWSDRTDTLTYETIEWLESIK